MMIRIWPRRAVVACASLALLTCLIISPAPAGTIVTGSASVSGPGLGFAAVPAIETNNIDNDNQTGGGAADNNIIVPLKRFDQTAYVDIEFSVAPSNGVTEYKVFEFVDNHTGSNWPMYIMQLGFGTGAGFVPSLPGDGIDFDHPTFDTPPSSGAFSSVTLGEDTLVFANGIHNGGAQPYQFRLDVGNLGTAAVGRFTLRQTPIPEPASLVLIGLAVTALALIRRR